MGWKDWNYKKRISLIFLLTDLILIIAMFPFYLRQTISTTTSSLIKTILTFISNLGMAYPLSFLLFQKLFNWTGCGAKGETCMKEAVFGTLGGIFAALIIYFFIGFFIGWLVDKLRKNKVDKLAIEPFSRETTIPSSLPQQQKSMPQSPPVLVETLRKEEIIRKRI
jgi:hypothetical protein